MIGQRKFARQRNTRLARRKRVRKQPPGNVNSDVALLCSAMRCVASMATEDDRLSQICAAAIVNMMAFSLWWTFCCWFGLSLWWYVPALLLAHPLALLSIGGPLTMGALLNSARGGGFSPQEVIAHEQRAAATTLPPIEILSGDESLLQGRLRAPNTLEATQ